MTSMTAITVLILVSFLQGLLVNCRTDYDDLYRSDEFMTSLPSLVSHCTMDSEYESVNKIECNVADYVTRISKRHKSIMNKPVSAITPTITTINYSPFEKNSLSYEKIFTDYVSGNVPMKSQMDVPMTYSAEEIAMKCGEGFSDSLVTCKEYQNILESFLIPKIAANSYLFRLPSPATTTPAAAETNANANSEDYRLLWPAILSIDIADTPIVRMCPQQMHMLVWGTSGGSGGASKPLRARVFHESAARHFSPVIGSPGSASSTISSSTSSTFSTSTAARAGASSDNESGIGSSSDNESGIGSSSDADTDSESVSDSESSGSDSIPISDSLSGSGSGSNRIIDGITKKNVPLHYTTFLGSGYPKISHLQAEIDPSKSSITIPMKTPRFAEVVLEGTGDYLFIPQNYMVSFYPTGISEEKTEKNIENMRDKMNGNDNERKSYLFQACFVDASNLNKFKDSLELSSKISKSDYHLLTSLLTNDIDIKMERSITDTLLSEVLNGKVTPVSGEKQPSVDSSDAIPNIPNTPKKRTRSSDRSSGSSSSSSSFRDWQEENKWNLLISSLTLPRPQCPKVISAGRNNVTIEWSSPYIPGAADTTRFGFNVTICKRNSNKYSGNHGNNGNHGDNGNNRDENGRRTSLLSGGDEDEVSSGTESNESNDGNGDGSGDGCSVWVLERGGAVLSEYIDQGKTLSTGVSSSLFSAILLNLEPTTYYSMQMSLFYDSSESMGSEWSTVFRTQSITVPSTIPHPSGTVTTVATAVEEKKEKSSKKKKNNVKKSKVAVPAVLTLLIGGFRAQKGVTPNTVSLQFCSPFDDGGSEVLGYQVWSRYDDLSLFHQEWHWLGAHHSTIINLEGYSREIVVSNLLPNSSYIFKASAYNSIGNASLSYPSNMITTAAELTSEQMISSTYSRLFLYGRGHPLFGPTRSLLGSLGGPLGSAPTPSTHVLVTLDDLAQTLTMTLPVSEYPSQGDLENIPLGLVLAGTEPEPNQESGIRSKVPSFQVLRIDGWISHFSPMMFSVTAECVWVSPPRVAGGHMGVVNGGEVRGRIAIVLRGLVPIVLKALAAQHHGAVGLIVIDEGACKGYDQNCLPGAQKSRGEGFARLDVPKPWKNVKIPVIFLLQEEARVFLSATGLPSIPNEEGQSDEL